MPDPPPITGPAEEMQEETRWRGDLLTVATRISHDLRTPLGSITNTCEMLKEVAAEADPASAQLFNPVFQGADEVARLLERVSLVLKASANPEPKRLVPMAEPVSIALQRLERRILAQKATVRQPPDWPVVSGVSRWLEVIWWNFIVNALQHGKEAPQIELGWARAGNGGFHFTVEDDGKGVAAEIRSRLFQPFHTLHKMNSTRGLGLSIVQRLVELQGGACGYEPGAGRTRFFFSLPAACQNVEK